MPVPLIVPLALSMAPAAAQGVQSLIQKNKAKKLKPSNFIPSAIKEAETNARNMAQATQMPGQDRFEARLGKATANTTEAARRSTNSPTALLETVQEADARTKGAVANNKANLDAFKLQGQNMLSNTLMRRGQIEQANRDAYNATKSATIGASQQNAYNAITNAANVGVVAATGGFNPGTTTSTGMTAPQQSLADFKKLIASGMATPEQVAMYNKLLAGQLAVN